MTVEASDSPLTVRAADTPVVFLEVCEVCFESPDLFEVVPPPFGFSDPPFAFPELVECVPPGGFRV